MKLNYDRGLREEIKSAIIEWEAEKLIYEFEKQDSEFKKTFLESLFDIVKSLNEDCNVLEAEIRRLQELYESDDLK